MPVVRRALEERSLSSGMPSAGHGEGTIKAFTHDGSRA